MRKPFVQPCRKDEKGLKSDTKRDIAGSQIKGVLICARKFILILYSYVHTIMYLYTAAVRKMSLTCLRIRV